MATDLVSRPATAEDDLGIDREFLMMLARIPFIAAGWMLAAWAGQQLSPAVPVMLLCGGMILAAVIDGVKFKVPNWLTLSERTPTVTPVRPRLSTPVSAPLALPPVVPTHTLVPAPPTNPRRPSR